MAGDNQKHTLWEATAVYVEELERFPSTDSRAILMILRHVQKMLLPEQEFPSTATNPSEIVARLGESIRVRPKANQPKQTASSVRPGHQVTAAQTDYIDGNDGEEDVMEEGDEEGDEEEPEEEDDSDSGDGVNSVPDWAPSVKSNVSGSAAADNMNLPGQPVDFDAELMRMMSCMEGIDMPLAADAATQQNGEDAFSPLFFPLQHPTWASTVDGMPDGFLATSPAALTGACIGALSAPANVTPENTRPRGTAAITPPATDSRAQTRQGDAMFSWEEDLVDLNSNGLFGVGVAADGVDGAADGQWLPAVGHTSIGSRSPGPEGGASLDVDFGHHESVDDMLTAVSGFPEGKEFAADGGTLTRDRILELLEPLQPSRLIPGRLINYFARRLSRPNLVRILDTDWYRPSGTLPQLSAPVSTVPLLVPCFDSHHWSLVEVDPASATITHYDSLGERGHGHRAQPGLQPGQECHHCSRIMPAVSSSLQSHGMPAPGWRPAAGRCGRQENQYDCGVFVLWLLHLRVAGKAPDVELPEDYRVQLARAIYDDVRKTVQKQILCESIDGGETSHSLKRKLATLEARSRESSVTGVTDGDVASIESLWKQSPPPGLRGDPVGRLRETAQVRIGGQPMGFSRANRLLQLAVNIASPQVFLALKLSVTGLRSAPDCPLPEDDICGVYEAGVWHTRNESVSIIGLRLISWYFHMRVSELPGTSTRRAVSDLAGMVHHKMPHRKLSDIVNRIAEWNRRGRQWANLVSSLGDEVNVLCFLPRDQNLFASEANIGPSEYRDLKKDEASELGRIVRGIRPPLHLPAAKELYNLFLWRRTPDYYFQIEFWSDEDILQRPLGAEEFDTAFKRAPHDIT